MSIDFLGLKSHKYLHVGMYVYVRVCKCAEKGFNILIPVLPRFFYTSLVKLSLP